MVFSFFMMINRILMVEQADAGECHGNTVLVASFDNMVVTYRTSGLCNIFYAALVSTFNVIAKREESVRT